MALPPFTLEALESCVAGGNPSNFYLPHNQDLRDHADLVLVIEGQQLPAHRQIVTARAPVFSPLLATAPAGPLESPFGIDSLRSALLLLRLCYRPEEAAQGLSACFDAVLDLLPVLHRVNATAFLSAVDLSGKPQEVLLAWLNVCCQLDGLEALAADCAARFVNGVRGLCYTLDGPPTDSAFSCLAMAQLPLEGLCQPAMALLCRAALALVADTRRRMGRLQFDLEAEAAAAKQARDLTHWALKGKQAREAAVREVSASDMLLLTPRALHGSHNWHLDPIPEEEFDDRGSETIVSPPFSVCGLEWRLRMTPDAEPPADAPLPEDWVGGNGQELPKWCSITLEAVHPERLPAAGLQAYIALHLDNHNPQFVCHSRRMLATLSCDVPAAAFHPFADSNDILVQAFDHANSRYIFKLRLELCLLPAAQQAG